MPDKGKRHINFGEDFAVRDNTRTRFIPERGFISDMGHENRPGDVDITDNPMGWMPVIGDVLQGGQVIMDVGQKKYGRALLGAAGLLVPNILEKPVKQLVNGAVRRLRYAPSGTISLDDAIWRPYKGTNFIRHELPIETYSDEILNGYYKAMAPSMSVNRVGDFNVVDRMDGIRNNPFFYSSDTFIGDKGMLRDAKLYPGDAMTPQVYDAIGMRTERLRPEEYDEVTQKILNLQGTPFGYGTGSVFNDLPEMPVSELEFRDLPDGQSYFEAKMQRSVPLGEFKYGVFADPASSYSLNPIAREKVLQKLSDNGMIFKTFMDKEDRIQKILQMTEEHPDILFGHGGILSRIQKHYGSNEKALEALRSYKINGFAKGGRKYNRNSKTDAGDLYYDIVRQRRNSAFGALLRSGETPENAARLAPLITTQQTMEGGWRLNRKDNNYGGMRASGKTIAFDSEDAFQDAYLKMLDSKWHTGRAAENSWRSAQSLDDWARILNREDLGLHTEADWNAYNKGRKGNDFVYLYAPEWENNNKPYREHLRKTEDLTKMYLDMLDKDEPYCSLVPMPEYELPEVTVTPQSNVKSKPVLFNSLIPASVMGMINNREDGGLLLTDYRSGGKIRIKPENRGKFTALKKRTGHSASWFKAHGTPAQKKMAVFALNAKKWKHGDGGVIDRLNRHTSGDPAKMLELIQMVRKG